MCPMRLRYNLKDKTEHIVRVLVRYQHVTSNTEKKSETCDCDLKLKK